MDPHSFIARSEAQRWLATSEKLLMGGDLVGSKTFAIRARDADPRLELAEQILAIADTLLAADERVGANNNQPDWYSILQLVRLTNDSELIANQYRRLALLLNPSQTQLPYADQAFQLVSEAWYVLSNPMRKSIYDSEVNYPQQQQQFSSIGFTHEVQPPPPPQQQYHHQQPPQPPQQQHNFFSAPQNVVGSSREQERPESQFVTRPHQHHNFLSQPNLIGSVHEPELPTRPSYTQPQPQQQHVQQPQVQQRPQPLPAQPQIQPQPQPSPQAPPQPQPQPQPQQSKPRAQQKQQREKKTATADRRENSTSNGVREDIGSNGIYVDGLAKFWTACPFCLNMYEYFKVYADCTLRCQNCKRAFQAVPVQSPPLVSDEGKDEVYYYCWGFFPLGISKSSSDKNSGNSSSWSPFSPIAAAPAFNNFQGNLKRKRN